MKHSQIIQENLDRRTSKKEKIKYLLYAYKEWVIGISIAIICLSVFLFSMFTNEKPDLSVRIITDGPLASATVDNITADINSRLDDEVTVNVQHLLINSPTEKQVLLAQMSAREIDLFIIPDTVSKETTEFMSDMLEVENIFSLNDSLSEFIVSKAVNAPHIESINMLEKATK